METRLSPGREGLAFFPTPGLWGLPGFFSLSYVPLGSPREGRLSFSPPLCLHTLQCPPFLSVPRFGPFSLTISFPSFQTRPTPQKVLSSLCVPLSSTQCDSLSSTGCLLPFLFPSDSLLFASCQLQVLPPRVPKSSSGVECGGASEDAAFPFAWFLCFWFRPSALTVGRFTRLFIRRPCLLNGSPFFFVRRSTIMSMVCVRFPLLTFPFPLAWISHPVLTKPPLDLVLEDRWRSPLSVVWRGSVR